MNPWDRAMRPVAMSRPGRRHPIHTIVGIDPAGEGVVVRAEIVDNRFVFFDSEPLSDCTDLAVRTHVPVMIDGLPVLIPLAGADRVMRDIAAVRWPDDPSPLEEQGDLAGDEAVEDAVAILSRTDLPAGIAVAQALDVLDPDGSRRRLAELDRRAS